MFKVALPILGVSSSEAAEEFYCGKLGFQRIYAYRPSATALDPCYMGVVRDEAHIDGEGERLFELICQRDMEGIVAKPMASPYRELNGKTPWIKIKNPDYSQAEGRGEMFQVDR